MVGPMGISGVTPGINQFRHVAIQPSAWVWIPSGAALADGAERLSRTLVVDCFNNPSTDNTLIECAPGYALRGFLFNVGPGAINLTYQVRFPLATAVWRTVFDATISAGSLHDGTSALIETTLGPFPEFRISILNTGGAGVAVFDAMFWIRSAQ